MNETDEQRLVIKDKTFNDIAVNELGKQRARCICCIQFGRCKQSDCRNCKMHKKYVNLTSVMTEYDQLRLHNYIGKYYDYYSGKPELFERCKDYVRRTSLLIGMFIAMLGLAVIFIAMLERFPGDRPPARYIDVSTSLDRRIVKARRYTANNIYDHNEDGELNCIDYATVFYEYWYNYESDSGYKCEIVRNKNPDTGMHHLFVVLRGPMDVEVEPWYTDKGYIMSNVWEYKYDRKYNIYGETNKWLNMRNN